MTPTPDPFEKSLHRALRALPPRTAPESLARRVLAEIARRQNLPWWNRSWATWPLGVRAVFVLLSVSVVVHAVVSGFGFFHFGAAAFLTEVTALPLARLGAAKVLLVSLGNAGSDLYHLIPSTWVYGLLAGLVLLYATVCGVGVTAYRVLWKAA